MIPKILKSELTEVGTIFLLANTPLSLWDALLKTSTVDKLRMVQTAELVEYWNKLSTRADRTAVSMGLCYSVLIGLLLSKLDTSTGKVDPSRLVWGTDFEEIAKSNGPANQVFLFTGDAAWAQQAPAVFNGSVRSNSTSSIILNNARSPR